MTPRNTDLDRLRAGRSELENHYIDELVAGRLNRRDFLRRGSAIGMSATLLGTVLAACGSGGTSSSSSGTGTGGAAVTGGTLRIASVTPAAAVNPLTVADAGGLLMLTTAILAVLLGRRLAQRGAEQGFVDATVEHRDSELNALADHLLPFHL